MVTPNSLLVEKMVQNGKAPCGMPADGENTPVFKESARREDGKQSHWVAAFPCGCGASVLAEKEDILEMNWSSCKSQPGALAEIEDIEEVDEIVVGKARELLDELDGRMAFRKTVERGLVQPMEKAGMSSAGLDTIRASLLEKEENSWLPVSEELVSQLRETMSDEDITCLHELLVPFENKLAIPRLLRFLGADLEGMIRVTLGDFLVHPEQQQRLQDAVATMSEADQKINARVVRSAHARRKEPDSLPTILREMESDLAKIFGPLGMDVKVRGFGQESQEQPEQRKLSSAIVKKLQEMGLEVVQGR